MKKINLNYKRLISYIFWGILTTFVNILSYYICTYWFQLNTVLATTLAWIFAVVFAFITNRKYVFESQAYGIKKILAELISFFGCRFATGILDILIMYVCVDLLGANDLIIKCLANGIVIIMNYITSKLIIFKNCN